MGGVGWGMLTSFSWYVDGRGGVGHVNVIFKDFWFQVGVNFSEVGVCFVPSTGTTSESFCITVSVWYHGRIHVRLN